MSLAAHFSTAALTPGQAELVRQFEQFIHNDVPVFVVKGYAGTGKTFMLSGITNWLAERRRPFRLAAPTGRAAKIVGQRTQKTATTLHKLLYAMDNLKSYEVEDEQGMSTFKFFFDLQETIPEEQTVILVDEASMVSDQYAEGEFFRFGSGRLLHDLFQYSGILRGRNLKVVFIGDDAQLPPVNMNHSPALSAAYLSDTYQVGVMEHTLTDVVRQASESGILQNATYLRNALAQQRFNELTFDTAQEDVHLIAQADLVSTYLQESRGMIPDDVALLAWSNKEVKEYNLALREHFFPGETEVQPGERLLVVRNVYKPPVALMNGEFVNVTWVGDRAQSRTITVKEKGENGKVEEVTVTLRFREVGLLVQDENNEVELQTLILENLLYSDHASLTSHEQRALYVDFVIRHPHLKPNTKDFRDAIKTDPMFNALQVKFGYALTVHKAQGGEWRSVLVQAHRASTSNADYFRWLYTALTRSKRQVYLANLPQWKPWSGATAAPPATSSTPTALLAGFAETLAGGGMRVEEAREYAYLVHLHVRRDEDCGIVLVNYNKQGKPTSIRPKHADDLLGAEAAALLQKPPSAPPAALPAPTEPFLEDVHRLLRDGLSAHDIHLAGVHDFPWRQRLTFSRGDERADIDLNYNGKHRITRFQPKTLHATTDFEREVLQHLNTLLQ